MSERSDEMAQVCPACDHDHPDADCACGCEWDPAFCGACGWIDCECPEVVTPPEGSAS